MQNTSRFTPTDRSSEVIANQNATLPPYDRLTDPPSAYVVPAPEPIYESDLHHFEIYERPSGRSYSTRSDVVLIGGFIKRNYTVLFWFIFVMFFLIIIIVLLSLVLKS